MCLHSLICAEPVRKLHCWFSHDIAHIGVVSLDDIRIIRFVNSCILMKSLKTGQKKWKKMKGVNI